MSGYCMGGWCQIRNKCAAYAFTPKQRAEVSGDVRLCVKGREVAKEAPAMTPNERIAHHQSLADAHMTIVQGLKYPTTLGREAVVAAERVIEEATRAHAHVSGVVNDQGNRAA